MEIGLAFYSPYVVVAIALVLIPFVLPLLSTLGIPFCLCIIFGHSSLTWSA